MQTTGFHRGKWLVIALVAIGILAALAGLKWRKLEPKTVPASQPLVQDQEPSR